VAKSIASAPGLALAAATAARSDPAPLSRRLVTVKALGRLRSSRGSTWSRLARGWWGNRRTGVPERRSFMESNRVRNHMGISFTRLVCVRVGTAPAQGANRVPTRRECRAGGGLLGGKDLTGRFSQSLNTGRSGG